MAQFETWLKTDLKKPLKVQNLTGNVFTSDNQANLIGVEIFDDGQPATVTGGVMGYAIREDGYTVIIAGTLSINKASVVLPASCYVVPGMLSVVVKVGETTVGAVVGNVYRTTTDSIVDPGHVVPSIEELLAKIADCEAATAAANAATASANTAASSANSAASSATTAAGNATTAANSANTAAGNATTAAGTANTAADAANDAADDATAAAGSATTAAGQATTAAGSANTAATNATTAASEANTAAGTANTAATNANSAAGTANTAAAKIDNMTADAENLHSGSSASATVSEVSGHKHIHFGIPRGADGRDGIIADIGLGLFAANIDSNGDLIITYNSEPPALSINSSGDLIYTIA